MISAPGSRGSRILSSRSAFVSVFSGRAPRYGESDNDESHHECFHVIPFLQDNLGSLLTPAPLRASGVTTLESSPRFTGSSFPRPEAKHSLVRIAALRNCGNARATGRFRRAAPVGEPSRHAPASASALRVALQPGTGPNSDIEFELSAGSGRHCQVTPRETTIPAPVSPSFVGHSPELRSECDFRNC
jgi:hypothetical protein